MMAARKLLYICAGLRYAVAALLLVTPSAKGALGEIRVATPSDFVASLNTSGSLDLALEAREAVRDSQLTPGVGWRTHLRVLRSAPLEGDALVLLRSLVARADTAVTLEYPTAICDTCTSVIQDIFFVRRHGGDRRVVLEIDACARELLFTGGEIAGAVTFQEDTLGIVRLLLEILNRSGRGGGSLTEPVDCQAYERGQVANVQLPDVESGAAPVYPPMARENGVDGTVLVDALVGTDGSVRSTHVRESIPVLDAAAVEAVRQWRFQPAKSKGVPIAVWVVCPVRFRLH